MPSPNICLVILTFNEEKHLQRCIESAKGVVRHVVVIDSFSIDRTVDIARSQGAEIFQNRWVNYATQFNWGLQHCNSSFDWVMRLDADEVVTPELAARLQAEVPSAPDSVAGFTVNRRIYFLGKWIRHGGIYPIRVLRIWRTGKGHCEQRWMDEHIAVNGNVSHVDADIWDNNLNSIGWWTDKHNGYATREAIDLLMLKHGLNDSSSGRLNMQAQTRRWLKERVYARLPLGLRAFCYFMFRYFVKLGFLDGWQGLIFHLLQGLWYRFLVDVKVYEIESLMKSRSLSLAEAIEQYSGNKIGTSKLSS